ncbi:MAG: hypothetical protein GQ583_04685 [Methyloprofundus sp.]|nr:hypothetical protein [Methyloprofundus sp.]
MKYINNAFFSIVRILLIAVIVGSSGFINAAVITTGCANSNLSCSMDELFGGASFIINDKLFDNFQLFDEFFSSPVGPDYGQVDVFFDDQINNPGIWFNINNQFTVFDADFLYIDFGFNVWTLDGKPKIKDSTLGISDFNFGDTGGLMQIDEAIFDQFGNFLGDKHVEIDNFFGTEILEDSIDFTPQAHLFIENEIWIEGDFLGDEVELVSFHQHFSQIPEPCTPRLIAMGFSGLLLKYRKKTVKL